MMTGPPGPHGPPPSQTRPSIEAEVARQGVRVDNLEQTVKHIGEKVDGIAPSIAAQFDAFWQKIDERFAQTRRDARFNWTPISIMATIIGVVMTAALTAMLWGLTQYNSMANELNRVRAEGGDRVASAQISHIREQHVLFRADMDDLRKMVIENRGEYINGLAAARAESASVHKTLTWLQVQFEGEQRMRNWQTDLFREYDITPKPKEPQP